MTPHTILSVLGPALTAGGAGLLAYDVLRGPTRLRRERRHAERVGAAGDRRDATALSLTETKKERSAGEQKAGLAEIEARHAKSVRRAETTNANADGLERERAFYLGVGGLVLVSVGALMQTVAAVLAIGV